MSRQLTAHSDGRNRTSGVCFISSLSRRTHSNAGHTRHWLSSLNWFDPIFFTAWSSGWTQQTTHPETLRLPSGVMVPLTTRSHRSSPDQTWLQTIVSCFAVCWTMIKKMGIRIEVEECMYFFKNIFYTVYIFSILRLLASDSIGSTKRTLLTPHTWGVFGQTVVWD